MLLLVPTASKILDGPLQRTINFSYNHKMKFLKRPSIYSVSNFRISGFFLTQQLSKGQLISKFLFGVIFWTKKSIFF